MTKHRRNSIFPALLLAALGAAALQASAIISLSDVVSSGSDFTWKYSATIGGSLTTGEQITIYDVSGYVAGSITPPANFSATALLTGLTPSLLTVPDSNALWNVSYTYTGPTTTLSSPLTEVLSFQAIGNTSGLGYSSYQDSTSQGVGSVTVPTATAGSTTISYADFTVAQLGSLAPQGGSYVATFQADNPTGFGFESGSFFTVLDIPEYVAGSVSAPPNWRCIALLTGQTPPNTAPSDNPALWNLSCTYTGPPMGGAGAVVDVSLLTASSGPFPTLSYVSEVFGEGSGNPIPNNQVIGTLTTDTPLPEPGTGALIGMAFLVILTLSRFSLRYK